MYEKLRDQKKHLAMNRVRYVGEKYGGRKKLTDDKKGYIAKGW